MTNSIRAVLPPVSLRFIFIEMTAIDEKSVQFFPYSLVSPVKLEYSDGKTVALNSHQGVVCNDVSIFNLSRERKPFSVEVQKERILGCFKVTNEPVVVFGETEGFWYAATVTYEVGEYSLGPVRFTFPCAIHVKLAHPFGIPVHSLDATVSQMNTIRPPHGPMMVMPPGIPAPFPPPMPMRFPPMFPMPLLHQMGPNGPPMGPMHSQPPSEPLDAGSLSHTPDSENDARTLQQPPAWLVALGLAGQGHGHARKMHPQQQQQHHHQVQALIPQMQHVQIATEPITMKDAETQSDPIKIEVTKEKAARMLTELLGQIVIIN